MHLNAFFPFARICDLSERSSLQCVVYLPIPSKLSLDLTFDCKPYVYERIIFSVPSVYVTWEGLQSCLLLAASTERIWAERSCENES